MKGSLYLGMISGIKLFVHWTFLLLIGWIVISGVRQGWDVVSIFWYIGFIMAVFVCVTLHELGHATAAKKYDIKTRDIILLPIGGLARLEKMPEVPRHELVVAIAGPLVNVIIAAVLFAVNYVVGQPAMEQDLSRINGSNFIFMLLIINIILIVFNMIPAFPMDGGRVLRALLAMKMERPKATRVAAYIGQAIAAVFIVIGFFQNPFLIFIGVFIILGARAEARFTETQSVLKNVKVKDVIMGKYSTLNINENIGAAVKALLDGQATSFLVMNGGQVAGTLNRNEIIQALSEKGEGTAIGEVMNKDVVFLNPDAPLQELYAGFNGNANSIYPVMKDNVLTGVLDAENIAEYIMVHEALARNKAH